MVNEEVIEVLQEQIDKYGQEYDDRGLEALYMAIKALEREQQFLDAGYKNGRIEFMIGGRKFMVKEMAQ